MKFKMTAVGEIDVLTQHELRESLAGWMAEITRGVRYRQFSAGANVAGGVWTIGGTSADNNQDTLGPRPGMLWAITGIAVSGNGVIPGTDLFSVYTNEVSPSTLVVGGLTRGQMFDIPPFVLNGGDQIALAGVGTGVAGIDVTVSGRAVEVPDQLGWQLL